MKTEQVTAGVATAAQCVRRRSPAWLRNAQFDGAFIGGGVGLALLSATAIVIEPSLFYPILLLDMWVLGYHHVIATFTQLGFDRASFQKRRGLIVHLLPTVALATLLVAWQVGLWVIVTLYFYWQWWHYARRSTSTDGWTRQSSTPFLRTESSFGRARNTRTSSAWSCGRCPSRHPLRASRGTWQPP